MGGLEAMSNHEFECEIHNEHYFKLKSKSFTLKQVVPYFLKKAFNTITGIPSYALGHVLFHLIFNPLFSFKPEQNDFQYIQNQHNPDNLHQEDFAVINVTDKPSLLTRVIRNYARRFYTNFPKLPDFVTNFFKREMLRVHYVDEKKCDELIGRLSQQLNGISLDGKEISQLDPDKIFLKGAEFIDPELKQRFNGLINKLVNNNPNYKCKNFDIADNNKKVRFFTLESRDGAVLDSAEIAAPGECEKKYKDRTFVITCMPRSNNFTAWLKCHRIYANAIGTTYVSFNYRGVERSRGLIINQNYMISDALAQAERLLALGVKPENIGFQGECFGAAIATMAAAKMHQNGHRVKLFNTRSYQSLPKLMLYKILPEKGASIYEPLNWIRYLAGGLFIIIGIPILKITKWDMDVTTAYDSIPTEYKGFLAAKNDPIVEGSHASMYSMVKERRKKLQEAVKNKTAIPEEIAELKSLMDIKQHKFELNHHKSPKKINTHTCPLQMLNSRNGCGNARDYQIRFFRQAFQKDYENNPSRNMCPPCA